MKYEFRYVRGHVEVFLNGAFQFSSDTMSEALRELEVNDLAESNYEA